MAMHPIAREVLERLGQAGARITAAGVDAALETANEFISNVAKEATARIQRGRAHAQKIGRNPPPRRAHVDDAVDGEVIEQDEFP